MCYTDNPINDWDNYCAEQERELNRRPICTYCDHPITDDYVIEINGELICESCFDEHHRKPIEDFME